MARLEDLTRGVAVKGVLPDGFITVLDITWIGRVAIELTYKGSRGKLANELIYPDREATSKYWNPADTCERLSRQRCRGGCSAERFRIKARNLRPNS